MADIPEEGMEQQVLALDHHSRQEEYFEAFDFVADVACNQAQGC